MNIAKFDHPSRIFKTQASCFHSKLTYVDLVASNLSIIELATIISLYIISQNILRGNEAISMSILQGIYSIGANNTRHRSKFEK